MTSSPSVTSLPTSPDASDACDACPHKLSEHDAISLRFCRATVRTSAASRACVCPS